MTEICSGHMAGHGVKLCQRFFAKWLARFKMTAHPAHSRPVSGPVLEKMRRDVNSVPFQIAQASHFHVGRLGQQVLHCVAYFAEQSLDLKDTVELGR